MALLAVAYGAKRLSSVNPSQQDQDPPSGSHDAQSVKLIVGDQAQQNLKLTAKSLKVGTFWKSITLPGSVVDRPGVSDRKVVAPAVGTIGEIRRFPGNVVRPGDVLFVLKLSSNSVHDTQESLFKTNQEIKMQHAHRERLGLAGGVVERARIIAVENEIKRLEATAKADQEQLRRWGLSPSDVDGIADGQFVSDIEIKARPWVSKEKDASSMPSEQTAETEQSSETFDMQDLTVDIGQQVEAGQTLCQLSNHQRLAIEGQAFRDEIPQIEQCIKSGWPVEIDFQENAANDWPAVQQTFLIHYVANTIDPQTRTFPFLLSLENQSQTVNGKHGQQRLWRYRPGQKVWLLVRVEQVDNVFVLPRDAVASEGAEAFVFTQNVNTFERKAVRIVHQDRERTVIANDGFLPTYRRNDELVTIPAVVQNAAAQLNRMAKAGTGGAPKGYHVHADGSLHKNEDEGK
jgi:biotin carboxyl carrier protein